MQRTGLLRGIRAAALLAASPLASCGANGFASTAGPHLLPCTGFASTAGPHLLPCTGFASTAGPHLLPCTGFASTAGPHLLPCTGASRIRTFSSRGDDGRNGDSRGDGLDSSSPVTIAGNQDPGVDPFRGGGLRHDSGGGSGGESQQLLSQAAASVAPVAEQHMRHSWVTDDSAGLQQEEPRVDPFHGGGLRHDSGGGSGGEGQQLQSQAAASVAQVAEQHRPRLSAAGDSAALQDIARIVKEAVRAEFASQDVKRIVKEAVRAELKSPLQRLDSMWQRLDSVSQRLESVCDGLSALMEYTAAKQLQQDLGDDVRVHPNVRLTGAKSTSDCLLREADAEVKETAASALVKRLQGLSGLRAVLRYFLTRACADLMGLRKRSASAAAAAAATAAVAAAADASAADAAAAAADAATIATSNARDAATIQGHLVTLQALQDRLLVATAGTAVEAHLAAAAVTALGSAQGYIDTHRPRRPRAGHPPESSAASNSSTSSGGSGTGAGSRDDEHGDGQDSSSRSGDDDGGDGTQACTPYAAAMMLLDAMRHRKTDELLLLVTDGPVSMLVLSALQPATTLPLTAAVNTSSGSGSGGSFKPATHLEVDALAVRLKDSTLQVIIQEAKMTSNLATARKQVARIGTLFAYAYNVAVAAGAFGEGEPPRLRLEAQIVFARLKALPPAQLERMVELVPAEGERHMMRVRVTSLAGCAINP